MNDSGFFLTYDLKILYCQSIQTASSLKQLNLDTLAFMQYEGDKNVLLNSYALEGDEIETLTKQILMGKVGDELPEEDMKWIMDFEKLLKEDASLITNRDLAFNYFILKFILLGFSPEEAKNIVVSYYEHILRNDDVPHPQVMLAELNKALNNKEFWVKNSIKKEKIVEYKMIKKIIRAKQELGYKFQFESIFKAEYLSVIERSFVPSLIRYNQQPSYLVKTKLDLNIQMPYILQVYNEIVLGMILKVYKEMNLQQDDAFISNLLKEMSGVLKLYLTINADSFK